jgi:RimJ/RimL family protein N-acetyltransferase
VCWTTTQEVTVTSPAAVQEHRTVPAQRNPHLRIRRMCRGEHDAIRDVFAGLSARSRYLRFHAPMPRLSALMLHRLSAVERGRHVALVASVDGRDVAMARWVRDSRDPSVADVGISVADAYQGRGIAGVLLAALADSAAAAGIDRLAFSVHRENVAMLRVLDRYGAIMLPENDSYEGCVAVDAMTSA